MLLLRMEGEIKTRIFYIDRDSVLYSLIISKPRFRRDMRETWVYIKLNLFRYDKGMFSGISKIPENRTHTIGMTNPIYPRLFFDGWYKNSK